MKKIFTIASLLFASLALTAQTTNVTYTADNTTVFPTPERGLLTRPAYFRRLGRRVLILNNRNR